MGIQMFSEKYGSYSLQIFSGVMFMQFLMMRVMIKIGNPLGHPIDYTLLSVAETLCILLFTFFSILNFSRRGD